MSIQILTEDPNPPAPAKSPNAWMYPRIVKQCGPWSIKSYGGMVHIHKENVWDRPATAAEFRELSAILAKAADELEANK